MAGHVALALWFAFNAWRAIEGITWQWPAHLDTVGVDGELYRRAAATWLGGGNPWTAYTATNTWPVGGGYVHELFTGPPPTVLAFVPFVWIPEAIFVVGWLAVTMLAAAYTIRRLRLPLYWLLFPPMVTGIVAGNPHVVCLAMLLCGSNWLRALAAPMKAYAAIPMVVERQWRALGILAGLGILSLLLFTPLWIQYRSVYAGISEWLAGPGTEGGFSATRDPRLLVLTATALVGLFLVDRRAAGWLSVPALWPGTQYFYATFALPLRSPWLAALLAFSEPKAAAVVPWAISAYALARMGRGVVERRRQRVNLEASADGVEAPEVHGPSQPNLDGACGEVEAASGTGATMA
jgi:hypothetical protein